MTIFPESWTWFCPDCDTEVSDEQAVTCDDPATCVRTEQWGGDHCGHIVCPVCRAVLREVPDR
jgi:hypothetical protein